MYCCYKSSLFNRLMQHGIGPYSLPTLRQTPCTHLCLCKICIEVMFLCCQSLCACDASARKFFVVPVLYLCICQLKLHCTFLPLILFSSPPHSHQHLPRFKHSLDSIAEQLLDMLPHSTRGSVLTLGAVWLEIAPSPCDCVAFLSVSRFPPATQRCVCL